MKRFSITLPLVATGCLLMSACHNNPAEKHSAKDNAKTFQVAARAAENKLGKQNWRGVGYRMCMEHTNENLDCTEYSQLMLAALKLQKGYESTTLTDLTSDKNWLAIRDEYKKQVFNTID